MQSVRIVSGISLATVLWATATATCSAAAVGSATFMKPGVYKDIPETNITLIAGAEDLDRLMQRGCTRPKGNGDVNTAVIDENGKIETFVCPAVGGDQTLNFGEQAGVVNPDGTSSVADIATGATTAEAVVGAAAILAGVIGGGIGAISVENSNNPPVLPSATCLSPPCPFNPP
jgi:hypothetical protein